MLSSASRIPKTVARKGNHLSPVLPLIPKRLPSAEEDKGAYISFELQTVTGAKQKNYYRKFIRRFDEGTPQQWVELLRDLQEIWKQNAVSTGSDQTATVRAVVRGESLTTFEVALNELLLDDDGNLDRISPEDVQKALGAVTATVFPHRALETHKRWMNKAMFKPGDLNTRQMAAAINRMNNALPLFPGASDADKFTTKEIVGLLEWSLPTHWRAKFDLEGYTPTDHDKSRLIEACEAIERNQVANDNPVTPKPENPNSNNKKRSGWAHPQRKSELSFMTGKQALKFCKEHGENATHTMVECFTLKNRAKRSASNGKPDKPQRFTNKGFRDEINALAKGSTRKEVLQRYETAAKRELSKLNKCSAGKRKVGTPSEDEDTDSEGSVHVLTRTKPTVETPTAKRARSVRFDPPRAEFPLELMAEEAEYQERTKWLLEYGDESGSNASPTANKPGDSPN
jgi:hypothetical protein